MCVCCVCDNGTYLTVIHQCTCIRRSSTSTTTTNINSSSSSSSSLWTVYHCYWCSPFLSENTVFWCIDLTKVYKLKHTSRKFPQQHRVRIQTGLQCNNLFQRLWATTVMPWGKLYSQLFIYCSSESFSVKKKNFDTSQPFVGTWCENKIVMLECCTFGLAPPEFFP